MDKPGAWKRYFGTLFDRRSLILGESIKQYEHLYKEFLEVKYAYSFWKGRVALSAILNALRIKNGDEVVVPGFTCVVVPNAVIYCGGRPVYVDIDPGTFNIDVSKIEAKITPRTKAIIAQHTFGLPANLDEVIKLARQKGIWVIEDCAQALGALYNGRKVGTFGDAAFFSTQWSKTLNTGLGGVAVTNDIAIAKSLEAFRKSCSLPSKGEVRVLLFQLMLYHFLFSSSLYWMAFTLLHFLSRVGIFIGSSTAGEIDCRKPKDYEKLFSNAQARIGKEEFNLLEVYNAHRIDVAKKYEKRLRENGLPTAYVPDGVKHIFLRYPILVSDKEKIIKYAKRRNIELGEWFNSPVHPKKNHLNEVGYNKGDCPVAEQVAQQIINLPTHSKINDEEIKGIVDFLKEMRVKKYI